MGSRQAAGSGARRSSQGQKGGEAPRDEAGLGLWYDAVGLRTARMPQAGAPAYTERAEVPSTRPRAATRPQPGVGPAAATAAAYEPTVRPRLSAHVSGAATAPILDPVTTPRPLRRERPLQPLRVVRRRSRVRLTTLSLAVLVAVMAATALVGPMLLNVASMRIEWRLAQLEEQQDTLVSERASLSTQVAALGSTPRIMEQAQKLGMQPAARVNYVVLPGGDAAPESASAGSHGGTTQTR